MEFQDYYNTDGYDLSYPSIILKITLKRNIGYFIIQTFIPSTLFVGLGDLSVFISNAISHFDKPINFILVSSQTQFFEIVSSKSVLIKSALLLGIQF